MVRLRHLLLLRRCFSFLRLPETLALSSPSLLRHSSSSSSDGSLSDLRDLIHLLPKKPSSSSSHSVTCGSSTADHLLSAVSSLAEDLFTAPEPSDPSPILESRGAATFLRLSPDGSASLHLLSLLKSRPLLALEVFSWRRNLADSGIPLHPEEFAAAIALAGRARNISLATDLFNEAIVDAPKTCLYNALMTAYMYNGHILKTIAVFDDLERDTSCQPTIVSYNILLSLYGRHTLVDKMESVLHAVDESGIPRTVDTYNIVITGYLIGKMWDRMENTFREMEEGTVKPEVSTRLLMLRGYAFAGNLEKMERVYETVREEVKSRERALIRAMICAYCKSRDPDRILKIEELSKLMNEDEYRPWLHVLLIRVYAQEGMVDMMEQLIFQAFQRKTEVTTLRVVRSILATYFQLNAVDRLGRFIRQAEEAGWRLCRDLYHCKMVLHSRQNQLVEMHGVLDEMENYMVGRDKRTLLIMYKAYCNAGRRLEAETVLGMMWKHGFTFPQDAFIS
ncbi:pentatricopeptide repeat-containing protein At2g30780-like [Typha angustifolia]|uniref:pentatricopeptide repeat-containing protein At2g30780-like n=1 Tax=Typha angustifolia TaxID=59011 RepID=UPI003C2EE619